MALTKQARDQFIKEYINASKREWGATDADIEYLEVDALRAWNCFKKLQRKGIL